MKKKNILLLIILSLFSISCDTNFTSGLSGTIYELDGVTPFPEVSVYIYNNEEDWNSDYFGYKEDMENINDSQYVKKNSDGFGNFVPSLNIPVVRTKTDDNGNFTASKIIWNNRNPSFGKDGDIHNVYLLYYSRFAGSSSSENAAFKYGLIADENPVSVVSGGTNKNSVKAQIRRKSYLLKNGLSGYVRTSDGGGSASPTASTTQPVIYYHKGNSTDDEVIIGLYYMDNTCYALKEWKSVAENINSNTGYARTKSVEKYGNGNVLIFDHGVFSLLGAGTSYELIYDENDVRGYVWFYIKDFDVKKNPTTDNTYSRAFKFYTSTANIDSIKEISRGFDMFLEEPEV